MVGFLQRSGVQPPERLVPLAIKALQLDPCTSRQRGTEGFEFISDGGELFLSPKNVSPYVIFITVMLSL